MKIYIEANEEHGKGYQVRVAGDGGEADIIGFNPYTLLKAVRMAEKTLEIINRKSGADTDLRDVLVIDRDSVIRNRDYDHLSSRMAAKIESRENKCEEDDEKIDS